MAEMMDPSLTININQINVLNKYLTSRKLHDRSVQ